MRFLRELPFDGLITASLLFETGGKPQLALAGPESITVLEIPTGAVLARHDLQGFQVKRLALGAGILGASLLDPSSHSLFRFLNLATQSWLAGEFAVPPSTFAFSVAPSGSRALAAGESEFLYLFDLENPSAIRTLSTGLVCTSLSWHPDGHHFLFSSATEDGTWLSFCTAENPTDKYPILEQGILTIPCHQIAASFSPRGDLYTFLADKIWFASYPDHKLLFCIDESGQSHDETWCLEYRTVDPIGSYVPEDYDLAEAESASAWEVDDAPNRPYGNWSDFCFHPHGSQLFATTNSGRLLEIDLESHRARICTDDLGKSPRIHVDPSGQSLIVLAAGESQAAVWQLNS